MFCIGVRLLPISQHYRRTVRTAFLFTSTSRALTSSCPLVQTIEVDTVLFIFAKHVLVQKKTAIQVQGGKETPEVFSPSTLKVSSSLSFLFCPDDCRPYVAPHPSVASLKKKKKVPALPKRSTKTKRRFPGVCLVAQFVFSAPIGLRLSVRVRFLYGLQSRGPDPS